MLLILSQTVSSEIASENGRLARRSRVAWFEVEWKPMEYGNHLSLPSMTNHHFNIGINIENNAKRHFLAVFDRLKMIMY